MKLIANGINKYVFSNILPDECDEVDGVLAAVAYGSLPNSSAYDLIENCLINGYRMDLWMRYDHTIPVSIGMLNKLLKSQEKNIFTRFIPDILHSKIIWWKGYGAYIGSANLTERGWVDNIETGVFFDENTLKNSDLESQIEDFFDALKSENSLPLTKEYISDMQDMEDAQKQARNEALQAARRRRKVPEHLGLFSVDKRDSRSKQKTTFKRNWDEGLTQLRHIATLLDENYKPSWVHSDIRKEWHVDQFLHAYYTHKITGDNNSKPYEKYHLKNQSNPSHAVTEALNWWKNLSMPPSGESNVLNYIAPRNHALLSKKKIKTLHEKEIAELLLNINAAKTHITKIEPTLFNRPSKTPIDTAERAKLFAEYLESVRNISGQDLRELLYYVLYEGKDTDLWERVFNAGKEESLKLPHIGLNIISEIVGWARPEIAPPRNSRTNKALRALGFDVSLY